MAGGGLLTWRFWFALTRLGEAQVLLPAWLAGLAWLAFLSRSRPAVASGTIGRLGSGTVAGDTAREAAWRWLVGLVAGTAVTTASKVAFIGYGIGSAALDFTGFSGHSMYSAAILPVLAALVAGRTGAACGFVLAALVMVSRVAVHAHSWSEALAGSALGAAIAGWALQRLLVPRRAVRVPPWLPLLLACWLALLPWRAPPSRTHEWVTRLSLWLSDRPFPYTRAQMMFEARGGHIRFQRRPPATVPTRPGEST